MKKLSIEQKAKRYDEAINTIRNLVKAGLIYEDAAIQVFPELKESEDERTRKGLIGYFRAGKCENISSYHGISTNDILAWLKKQGEQKPTDKVEPKFHEGEWIVNNDNRYVYQITKIRDDEYCLWPLDAEIMGYLRIIDVNNDYRLWTIQDAKDGDVLADKDNNIGIYKEIEGIYWDSYIYLGCDGKLRGFSIGGKHEQHDTHPATKEQRDLLFQKMKEAGYEWDAEKKELKKNEQIQVIDYSDNLPKDNWELVHEFVNKFGRIPKDEDELNALVEYVLKRQNPAWSEEDGDIRDNIIRDLKRLSGDMVSPNQTYQKEIQWLKSLKDRVRVQPKQEWNEEDETHLAAAISIVTNSGHTCTSNWLKSLRDRYTWKPSEEQMKALKEAVDEHFDIDGGVLWHLYEDLKKLREE